MKFSILIPTYKRKDQLQVALEWLAKQPGLDQGEVVVGIDGSTDGTQEFLEGLKSSYPAPLTWFWQENQGRAVIRNRLIEAAEGEILIFIQDDILVKEGWLKAHLNMHEKREGAVVGHITWYPERGVSPYMKWLESGGHMLDFRSLKDGEPTDYWHFYMGNLSIPRQLLGDLRFDESLKLYGWEDIVLGYQVVSGGKKLYYCSSAAVYHDDEYREEDFQKYMEQVGESAVTAQSLVPDAGIVPAGWKRGIFWLLITLGKVFWFVLPQHARWYLQMKTWFLQAVSRAEKRS